MPLMTEDDRLVFAETLQRAALHLNLPLNAEQITACARYTDLLLETNAHTNLTRITEPGAVAIKHFADSLTVLRAVPDLTQGAKVADVGTGAGFPGMVLKIVRPDLRLALIDSLAKRLTFLQKVVDTLGLEQVHLVHARAEEAGRDALHRDTYDLVTARAVAALPTLLEWCGPLVRPSGRFLAMKTEQVAEELASAEGAVSLLALRLTKDVSVTLPASPGEDEPARRRLLVYEKLRATPSRFPRRTEEIKARPL